MNDTDITDAQVLRWLKAKAEKIQDEFRDGGVYVTASVSSSMSAHEECSFSVRVGCAQGFLGSTVEEAVQAHRDDQARDKRADMIAYHRAEIDRLEREAGQ